MSDDEEHSTEAELALKKRRDAHKQVSHGLDEAAKELLETNRKDRQRMADEISHLKERNAKRKQERVQLDKRLSAQRAADEERRKAAEEEKHKKKEEDDQKRLKTRAQKQAEFEKLTDTAKRNFVISSGGSSSRRGDDDASEERVLKKSKEQLEAEKKAILKQRIQPLEISGFDKNKLQEKAKELHKLRYKIEGEKYDLEKRFKDQQRDMLELADRARQAIKVGRGGLKRAQRASDEDIDTIQARFAGTPAKIEMFSKYERQKDKRSYRECLKFHSGPRYLYPVAKIKAKRIVKWDEEDGMPHYEDVPEGTRESHAHAAHAQKEE